jgi:hypothetical protein
MFVHAVFFWLKPGVGDDVRARLTEDCTTYLRKIPSVRHVWWGRPAMTPRDVVDNSYDLGLCVVLDDAKGLEDYQVHPLHKEFVARNKEHWKRLQAYDFVA